MVTVLACKVHVCEFNAKTTHPARFSWNHTEIHRMSASDLVTVSDRVRQETMMIRHCPKVDRCCPPAPVQPLGPTLVPVAWP